MSEREVFVIDECVYAEYDPGDKAITVRLLKISPQVGVTSSKVLIVVPVDDPPPNTDVDSSLAELESKICKRLTSAKPGILAYPLRYVAKLGSDGLAKLGVEIVWSSKDEGPKEPEGIA